MAWFSNNKEELDKKEIVSLAHKAKKVFDKSAQAYRIRFELLSQKTFDLETWVKHETKDPTHDYKFFDAFQRIKTNNKNEIQLMKILKDGVPKGLEIIGELETDLKIKLKASPNIVRSINNAKRRLNNLKDLNDITNQRLKLEKELFSIDPLRMSEKPAKELFKEYYALFNKELSLQAKLTVDFSDQNAQQEIKFLEQLRSRIAHSQDLAKDKMVLGSFLKIGEILGMASETKLGEVIADTVLEIEELLHSLILTSKLTLIPVGGGSDLYDRIKNIQRAYDKRQ